MTTTRRRLLAGLPALGLLSARADDSKQLEHIVFGSCLDTHEHPMLDRTLALPRDLFIFMGDNVYADIGGIPMMQEKYALLKNSRFFRGLKNKPILATCDDHDFGLNDGGSEYPQKREAQVEFWNWLDEPADSPRRKQEGVYHTQSFGPSGKRVQVILLDTRYFRSPLKIRVVLLFRSTASGRRQTIFSWTVLITTNHWSTRSTYSRRPMRFRNFVFRNA